MTAVPLDVEVSARTFLVTVAVRWPSADPSALRRTVRSILLHLRRRLPADAEDHLLHALPGAIAELSSTPELDAFYVRSREPVDNIDIPQFYFEVRSEGGLADAQQARKATEAVIAALVELLPPPESLELRLQLPPGLRSLWIETVELHETQSRALQRFRQEMRHYLPTETGERLDTIASLGIPGILREIGALEAARIQPYLPEELRIAMDRSESSEGSPDRKTATGELIDTLRVRAELSDSEMAKRALKGILRAVKAMAPKRVETDLGSLAHDWLELWRGA